MVFIKRTYTVVIIILILFISSSCGRPVGSEDCINNYLASFPTDKPILQSPIKILSQTYFDNSHKNSTVTIKYPKILRDGQEDTQTNQMIRDVINDFIELYGSNYENLELEMDYQANIYHERILSILWRGLGNVLDTAHPINWSFTVNIDLNDKRQIQLKDIYPINNCMIKELRDSSKKVDYKEEWLNTYTDDALMGKLENSDILFNGTYSFLADDELLIILEAPHVYGDYIELGIPYPF